MPTLTGRRKWRTRSKTDAQIGDLVLVVEDNLPHGRWIVKTFPGDDSLIRTVKVQTKQGTFKRPVAKLCLLERAKRSVQTEFVYRGGYVPDCLLASGFHIIELSPSRTRNSIFVVLLCNSWIASKIFVVLARCPSLILLG